MRALNKEDSENQILDAPALSEEETANEEGFAEIKETQQQYSQEGNYPLLINVFI